MIAIELRKGKDVKHIDVEDNIKVSQLVDKVKSEFDIVSGDVLLFYNQKLLDKNLSLKDNKIEQNATLYVLVKKPSNITENRQQPLQRVVDSAPSDPTTSARIPNSSSNPQPGTMPSADTLTSLFGSLSQHESLLGQSFAQSTAGSSNTSQIFENAAMLSNTPGAKDLISKMLSEPDTLETILNMSPEFKQAMEQNPEFKNHIRDPEFIKQVVELTTNPGAMREFMERYDRMLQQSENIPDGLNMLSRFVSGLQQQNETVPEREPSNLSAETNVQGLPLISNMQNRVHQPSTSQLLGSSSNIFSALSGGSAQNNTSQAQNVPLMQRLMKPEVVQAIQQYRQSIEVLMREVPEIVSSNPYGRQSSAGTPQQSTATNQFSSDPSNFFGSTPSSQNTAPRSTEELEAIYGPQLVVLSEMGFTNKASCIRALELANGDIDMALFYLTGN